MASKQICDACGADAVGQLVLQHVGAPPIVSDLCQAHYDPLAAPFLRMFEQRKKEAQALAAALEAKPPASVVGATPAKK